MKDRIVEGLVIILILSLGAFGLINTLQDWSTTGSVSVYIKIAPDKVFEGSNLWIGLTTNLSWSLGLIFMGIMTVLAKLKFTKTGILFAIMGMLLLVNWIIFTMFIV